ncbi:MAG TPA: type VI secretion system baseplate subunit TssK, partial [Stellaceae bacterium]|nr:type VI secretion system baseplate subunit TssK [Stellaceae bacterium]
MTWTNRVVWQEGMFLRAQHFQQQDRWLETLVRGRTAALRPHPWGIVEMAVDRDLLATGRFALTSATGVFEDGTPFSIPGETDHPPPLDLPEGTRNALVYLAAPIRQPGAVEIAVNGGEGRYLLRDFEAYDTHSGSPQPAALQIARLRLRYLLDGEERAGYLCIGLARIVEVAADRRATLDERWIPPALLCSAALPLSGLITELSGMLNQRGEALAARLTAPGSRGVADVADFLLLQSVNRWQKLLAHWADAANLHPEDLYSVLVQMAGE